jgi:hypothetical protein
MPLDYNVGDTIAIGERDLIFGSDTGVLKYREYFKRYLAASVGVWCGHNTNEFKIDCLTRSMSPSPPRPSATRVGHQGWVYRPDRGRLGKAALGPHWDRARPHRGEDSFRDNDRSAFVHFVSRSRYTPEEAAAAHLWNLRFKRSSKAGLI